MALERLALSRSTLDRAAHLRADPQLFTRLTAETGTRVIPVHDNRAPVIETPDGLILVFTPPSPATEPGSDAATSGEPGSPELLFLGLDDDGHGYLAHAVDDEAEAGLLPPGARWAGLREAGALLDDTGAGILTTSAALFAWHAHHRFCANCGHPTEVAQAGWVRHCPNCGREHYPRTDPAVIMSVVDAGDRILLGRQATWPELRFSTLAGFVEPGESLEDAVRREVSEECGITVGDVAYRGSQPWPFPSSLMLGFRGEAVSTEITVDAVEIAQARWWTRDELAADVKEGRLLLPPPVSIARRLIEDWFGAPVEGSETPWR